MGQFRIKNHFVPECYLKRWGNLEKKVYVYRTLVAHPNTPVWKLHSISAIAYQKHLYTQILAGLESDEIEKWLDQKFEAPANAVLDRAVGGGRLSSNDWDILIRFLAAQDVRTPARMLEHLERAQKDFPAVLEDVLSDLNEKSHEDQIEELKTQREASISSGLPLKITKIVDQDSNTGKLKVETYAGRSSWIWSIKYLLENTAKILHSHKWTIVKPAKGCYWPTSDNPVVKLNYYGQNNYDLKGGWGVEKGNILFPIGPEHAMFVQIGDRSTQRGTRLSADETAEFIKIIAENSHRSIFSTDQNVDLPLFKKRTIDPNLLAAEKNDIRDWHRENSAMEREYFSENGKT